MTTMIETVGTIPLLACERDENFIYIEVPGSGIHCKRHTWLKIKAILDAPIPDTYVEQIKKIKFAIELHEAPGAPATTRHELTVTVHEIQTFIKQRIQEEKDKENQS